MEKCYCGNTNLAEYSDKYWKCDVCRTLVSKYDFNNSIYHVNEEEKDLYGKNYWQDTMVKEANVSNVDELIDMYLTERGVYWFKEILMYVKLGKRIAEVGCGLGQLSYLLKQAEFQQTSYELSPYMCEYVRKKLGINIICGELGQVDEKYSSIIALDVFEHLMEPEKFIQICKRQLEESGMLILQTPCYDPQYTYEEMLHHKPRFQHLLVEEQHIFLYSKEAITALLKKYGFMYISFEKAFFGDDYDMFLFASQKPIQKNSSEDIGTYLNSIPDGRILKALIKLYDEKEKKEDEYEAVDRERQKILLDIEILTELVKKKQKLGDEFAREAESRLENIKTLTEENILLKQATEDRLNDVRKLIEENALLKQAAEERIVDIEKLTEDNGVLRQAAEERLVNVERLIEDNGVLRQAAEERLADVERLIEDNGVLRQAAEERLQIIGKLSQENEELKESMKKHSNIMTQIISSKKKK